jgi:integrase
VTDKSDKTESGSFRRVTSKWFDTLQEAREWQEEQKTRLRTVGRLAKDTKSTISDACSEWLSMAEKVGIDGRMPIEQATADRYRSSIRTIINPTIGLLKISELNTPMLRKWRDRVATDHTRDAANRALGVVKQALGYQVQIGSMPVDPAAAIKNLQIKDELELNEDGDLVPVESFLSPDEVKRILDAADALAATGKIPGQSGRGMGEVQEQQRMKSWEWARPLIYFLIASGARIGEASALQWGDVDWDKRTISIRRARKRSGKIGAPKNKHSIRTILMGKDFMQILRTLYVRSNDREPGEFIFGTDRKKPLNTNNFTRRQWSDLMTAAGFKSDGKNVWTPHDCRHYHASLLINAGKEAQLVADTLGHANTNVTLKIYVHLFKHRRGEGNTVASDMEKMLLAR